MEEMNTTLNPVEMDTNAAETTNSKDYILEVDGLKQHFPIKKSIMGKTLSSLKAVDGVSFKLERGKTLGVVGESGCGKTTLGRTLLRLYDFTDGSAIYHTKDANGNPRSLDLANLSKKELASLRTELQDRKSTRLNSSHT